MSAQLQERAPITIKQVLRLRAQQQRWQAVADSPGIRESARANAQAQVDRIEREIRHG